MGSRKKKAARQAAPTPARVAKARKAIALSQRANAEVEALLKSSRKGELSPSQLHAELREVNSDLRKLMHMILYFLT